MTRFLALFLAALLLASPAMAGVGGKLSGKIVTFDGEPLVGVNVVIDGTSKGTASDIQGEYFILNIPPGIYTIKFQMIGYKTAVHQNVRIISDFTTRLDPVMTPIALDAAEEVIVVAERPLIQRDATATIRVVGADDILTMPVDNFKDVLVTQAGFTTDESGGIHVRGGRTKEILYMIDGVVVRDPLEGDFSGSVNQNAIQEMTVISGTFNAEYGQAMSSVVNIVTKEGGEQFHGRLEYKSDQVNVSPYHKPGAFAYLDASYKNEDSAFVYVDLKNDLFKYYNDAPSGTYPKTLIPLVELPVSGQVSLSLGGPLFGRTSYYLSALYATGDSPLSHGVDINQDLQLKLNTRLNSQIKLVGNIHSSSWLYQNYSHNWKYLPQNHSHTMKTNDLVSLSLTHSLSEALFYNLHISNQRVGTRTGVQNLTPEQYERPLTDASVYFYAAGHQGIYTDKLSSTNNLDANLTYQPNKTHLIKSGMNLAFHTLDIYAEEDPWLGGTNFKDDTTYTPSEMSFYIQNKLEFDFIIINLGLRYDRIDPSVGMWEDVTRFAVWDSTRQNFVAAPVVDAPAQSKWSPRIGLAYPITENTVFHFSYGHFFQTPDFNAMTYNAIKDISTSLPLVGNAGVKPQKTVAFEVGVKQAISADTRLTATVWSKDIRDLLSTQSYQIISIPVVVYTNSDYASVQGVDISLDRRLNGNFRANLSYTLSSARGNNSSPISGYFSAYEDEEVPHKEYYLDFDQRHDLAMNLSISTDKKGGPRLLGAYPLGGINANLLLNAASGLPYTPYVDPTIQVEVNSARKPWTYSLDLRLRKQLDLGRLQPSLFLEAMNITDHENVLVVNSRTGKPFDLGASGLVGATNDSNLNPAKLGPGRAIKLGLSVNW
jgi:outer membrane receptor protein involved in Fe transport